MFKRDWKILVNDILSASVLTMILFGKLFQRIESVKRKPNSNLKL